MKLPFSSRITTSLVTRSTCTRKVGCAGGGRRRGRRRRLRGHGDSGNRHGGDAHGDGPETAVFSFIRTNYTSSVGGGGARLAPLGLPGLGRTRPAPATSTAPPMAACPGCHLRRSGRCRGLARRRIRRHRRLLCSRRRRFLRLLLRRQRRPAGFVQRRSPNGYPAPRAPPRCFSRCSGSASPCAPPCRFACRLLGRLLGPSAFAPMFGVGRGNRRRQQARPVEPDTRVLRFDRAAHIVGEREAADFHLRRRAEPEQQALAGRPASPRGARLDDREVLVSSSVARELQERHLFPLLDLRGLARLRGRPGLLRRPASGRRLCRLGGWLRRRA